MDKVAGIGQQIQDSWDRTAGRTAETVKRGMPALTGQTRGYLGHDI